MDSEKFKRSVLLTESAYHKAVEVSEEKKWSLSKSLLQLVKIGLNHKEELNETKKN